jgi:acyl-CoA thioesterase FadM
MTETTVLRRRPSAEGANIGMWVGFKHFLYLAEEGVRHWFREHGHPVHHLFTEGGWRLDIVETSALLPAVLELDDDVEAEATRAGDQKFRVRLRARRGGRDVTALRGTVLVALTRDDGADGVPPELLKDMAGVPDKPEPLPGEPAFTWSWRIPYFYCEYSQRMAHSGYVRALEEVVDRYLDDRGQSVGRLLAERAWIPVVSRVRVRVLAPAYMEETLHTGFTVEDISRDVMFTGRMVCTVLREGVRVPVASGTILHGYAHTTGPRAGQLAVFDDEVRKALGPR